MPLNDLPVAERARPRAGASASIGLPAEAPALIKGCLKCGTRVPGPPARDPAFNTADLPLPLELAALPDACRRRLLGRDRGDRAGRAIVAMGAPAIGALKGFVWTGGGGVSNLRASIPGAPA